MKLTMLGTGSALATECYNTCFLLADHGQYLLVDGGGGNGILKQIKKANVDWKDIRDIFVTHEHIDHLLGIVWMVRAICQHMNQDDYQGEARLYAHRQLIDKLNTLLHMLLLEKQLRFIGERLHFIPLEDGQEMDIIGHRFTFFDICSPKTKQFGFSVDIGNGEKLTCCGDETYNDQIHEYAQGSKWFMHEAFCLYAQADIFKPYEKHHTTVKEACETAQRLCVQNCILYHTEDSNLKQRKELYAQEGNPYFDGNLYIPDDLETLDIC